MNTRFPRRLLAAVCGTGVLACGVLTAAGSPATAAESRLSAAAGRTTAVVSGSVLSVTAAAGVENFMTISSTATGLVQIADSAGVLAGTGCKPVNSVTVQCSGVGLGVLEINVAGGDGDDTLFLSTSKFTRLTGGSGDDLLRSSSLTGSSRLSGNDGNDTVVGGPFDSLFGQNGNDVLTGGVFLSGGAGDDTLRSFEGRQTLDGGIGLDRADAGLGTDDRCVNNEITANCEVFTS